jgi:hypothetical protein
MNRPHDTLDVGDDLDSLSLAAPIDHDDFTEDHAREDQLLQDAGLLEDDER